MAKHDDLVAKVWNYAHVLRDQGVSYGDYLEQITYLLFLKMDQERDQFLDEPSIIPAEYRWDVLAALDGEALEKKYREALETLSKKSGLVGTLFQRAQNKLSDPAKLTRVVSLINKETWIGLDVDTKGEIYEGLLERNASEVKSGAGQYFTPRPVIDAIVECVRPKIGDTIHDPACGTGGFILSAYAFLKDKTQGDRSLIKKLREDTFSGADIVSDVVRLAAMNLYLRGLGNGESPIVRRDALSEAYGSYDIILTNPPFGKKSSYKIIGEEGEVTTEQETYERDDFKYTTSNKQLNFLQHIMTIMKATGRAAVVLPDNVLFEAGNAGEGIRKRLLQHFDFHTLLRLPTGIFYKPGVKANVLFFDKHKPREDGEPWTKALWIYDLRTNKHFTLKKNPLGASDLKDFIDAYKAGKIGKREESERFREFSYDDLIARDKTNLDIFWLKDDKLEDVDSLPDPDILAAEIVENLQEALTHFQEVAEEV
ncbi:SAM-dependent DNA methyltransferase [Parvularcula flava]|uniref:site-specific DNA-methyltransferase (adenine-specific) n=1 Tax=Aquisalinus luteolus TaxID=1566827 RepID=A0A8J3A4Z8_9PROT|nr:class I SAM-dependent DNA methyltransferase [Aquisalinus luteolus]NHK29669.1 SAM-dependent DNA methyltransferase [Aquisalinus luteolus]GGI02158.1 DNA methyltransferase [Aquisalinus luteolus]